MVVEHFYRFSSSWKNLILLTIISLLLIIYTLNNYYLLNFEILNENSFNALVTFISTFSGVALAQYLIIKNEKEKEQESYFSYIALLGSELGYNYRIIKSIKMQWSNYEFTINKHNKDSYVNLQAIQAYTLSLKFDSFNIVQSFHIAIFGKYTILYDLINAVYACHLLTDNINYLVLTLKLYLNSFQDPSSNPSPVKTMHIQYNLSERIHETTLAIDKAYKELSSCLSKLNNLDLYLRLPTIPYIIDMPDRNSEEVSK